MDANEDTRHTRPRIPREHDDPAGMVAAMASAVEHVRQMARTVFEGDAALFNEQVEDRPT